MSAYPHYQPRRIQQGTIVTVKEMSSEAQEQGILLYGLHDLRMLRMRHHGRSEKQIHQIDLRDERVHVLPLYEAKEGRLRPEDHEGGSPRSANQEHTGKHRDRTRLPEVDLRDHTGKLQFGIRNENQDVRDS